LVQIHTALFTGKIAGGPRYVHETGRRGKEEDTSHVRTKQRSSLAAMKNSGYCKEGGKGRCDTKETKSGEKRRGAPRGQLPLPQKGGGKKGKKKDTGGRTKQVQESKVPRSSPRTGGRGKGGMGYSRTTRKGKLSKDTRDFGPGRIDGIVCINHWIIHRSLNETKVLPSKDRKSCRLTSGGVWEGT